MTIEMYEDVMNHLQIDKYRELIIEQDQKITELEKSCDETQELLDKQIEATYRLDKENAELKAFRQDCVKLTEDNVVIVRQRAETSKQLTKAKEILEKLLLVSCNSDVLNQYPNCSEVLQAREEAVQFLSEVEK